MTHPHSQHTAGTSYHPLDNPAGDLDTFLIDDEFDDFLDRHLDELRESLPEEY